MSEVVEFVEEVSGIYFRSYLIPHRGTRIPQHVHDYDHGSVIGSGAVRVRVDGQVIGIYGAGHVVPIKAGQLHEFETLEDRTRVICVHSVESAESIKRKGL